MGWLATSLGSRNTHQTSNSASPSPWTAYDEQKTAERSHGTSLTAPSSSPWVVSPVKHPFQLTTTTSNVYSTAPSITSDTPLHPNSHLDMASPTTLAMSAPSELPLSNRTGLDSRRPPTRTGIASRLSHRLGPAHSWVIRNRNISLLLVLPIPCLLSVLYLVVGHAILHAANHSSPSSPYRQVSFLSSANAGAVGGAILTLPVIVLLYIIQRISNEPSNSSGPDDFFDDESDIGDEVIWRGILGYTLVVVIAVCVGVVAAPIGVSILRSSSGAIALPAAQAATAGVVGGVVFLPAVVALCCVL